MVVYYGLTLSITNLSGNVFTNFAISACMETLAYVITLVLLDRVGRKPLLTASMVVSGFSCTASIVPVLLNAPGGLLSLSVFTSTASIVPGLLAHQVGHCHCQCSPPLPASCPCSPALPALCPAFWTRQVGYCHHPCSPACHCQCSPAFHCQCSAALSDVCPHIWRREPVLLVLLWLFFFFSDPAV